MNLLNYSREVQDTRLKCECWERDTAGHFDVRTHDGAYVGYNTRAARFAEGQVVEMVGRQFLDLFQQDKLLPPGLNIAYRLMPAADGFVIKSPDNDNTQYLLQIETVELIMQTKQLTEATEVAHRSIVQKQNMRLPFTKVQLKHLSVAAGHGSIAFDNVFTGGQLPYLVIMGMITDDEFASGYQAASPFNIQHFNVSRVEMKKNGTTYPRGGYSPN